MADSAHMQLPILLSSVYSTGVRIYQNVSVTRSGIKTPPRLIDTQVNIEQSVRMIDFKVASDDHVLKTSD